MSKPPDKGEQSEAAVAAAVGKFIRQATLFKRGYQIVNMIHSRKSDVYDEAGIDMLIIFNTGLAMPLQIKSACKRIQRHKRRYPSIKYVFVVGEPPRDETSERRLCHRLFQLIQNAITYDCGRVFGGKR